MIRYSLLCGLAALALAAFPVIALAQGLTTGLAADGPPSAPPPDQPVVVRLALDPAAEPRPALKYELLPGYWEQKPGNAAQFYYRALLMASQIPKEHNKTFADDYEKWTKVPLAELPKDAMRAWVAGYQGSLGQLKLAVYREECNWDLRLRDIRGVEIISFLLPEFQEMRHLARVLRIKSRLEIAEGKYDEARESLRMGYKLAQDAAQPPLLINGLIGIAISATMNETLQELIAASGSPNLYWALADLPAPFIDLRVAMRQEMQMPLQMFPFLRDAETAQRTSEEWRNLVVTSLAQLSQVDGSLNSNAKPDWKMQLAAAALMMKAYPEAKKALLESGMSRERVEEMAVGQVVAIETSRNYFHAYHEMFKWTSLPYDQAWQKMADAEQRLIDEGQLGPAGNSALRVLPIASLLLPASKQVVGATARLETHLAGLRAIEAIRMHAAVNDGKLPRSLEAVTIVPVPNDPSTRKPFAYRVEGNKATLEVPAPATQPARVGKRYEITINAPRERAIENK